MQTFHPLDEMNVFFQAFSFVSFSTLTMIVSLCILNPLRIYQVNVLFPQLTLTRISGYYNADVLSGLFIIAFELLVIFKTVQMWITQIQKDNLLWSFVYLKSSNIGIPTYLRIYLSKTKGCISATSQWIFFRDLTVLDISSFRCFDSEFVQLSSQSWIL